MWRRVWQGRVAQNWKWRLWWLNRHNWKICLDRIQLLPAPLWRGWTGWVCMECLGLKDLKAERFLGMFPQHVVGCPVDVIRSKDSPPSSSSPWAGDDWQLRDCQGKCQTLCHDLHFLPWPSALSCCWGWAAALDRSQGWPSPHFILLSDRKWMLWKFLTATICLVKALVPFWEVGKVDVSQNWADKCKLLENWVYNKINK